MINARVSSKAKTKAQGLDPFNVSIEDFRRLEGIKKEEMIINANAMASPFLRKFFLANPDKDWVVLAHSWDYAAYSGDFGNYPKARQQEEMSHAEKVVVHLFERPIKTTH